MIEPYLPKPKSTGIPPNDQRKTLDAMIYREKEGCKWKGLPSELGNASGIYTRYRLWCLDGTIVRAHQHSAGAKKGGLRPRLEYPDQTELYLAAISIITKNKERNAQRRSFHSLHSSNPNAHQVMNIMRKNAIAFHQNYIATLPQKTKPSVKKHMLRSLLSDQILLDLLLAFS